MLEQMQLFEILPGCMHRVPEVWLQQELQKMYKLVCRQTCLWFVLRGLTSSACACDMQLQSMNRRAGHILTGFCLLLQCAQVCVPRMCQSCMGQWTQVLSCVPRKHSASHSQFLLMSSSAKQRQVIVVLTQRDA